MLSCCRNDDNQGAKKLDTVVKLIPTYDSLQWDVKVEEAIDSFVKEANCDSCINEMYVDEIYPDSILITLKSRVYSQEYMKQKNSLFSTHIHGKVFYIFSGLEDVLRGDKKFIPVQDDASGNQFTVWTLGIKRDKLYIIKGLNSPFFPVSPPKVEIIK
jgi:hypothetical protein